MAAWRKITMPSGPSACPLPVASAKRGGPRGPGVALRDAPLKGGRQADASIYVSSYAECITSLLVVSYLILNVVPCGGDGCRGGRVSGVVGGGLVGMVGKERSIVPPSDFGSIYGAVDMYDMLT